MFLRKWQSEVVRVFSRDRIIRVLVMVLTFGLLQIFPEPTNKYSLSQSATAANSLLIQTNLALNANATAGANDVGTQMTLENNPVHTNTGVGYYTFNNAGVAPASQKYAYKNLDFNNGANVSIFMWVYPTASGVILSHSGQADPFTGYRLTTFNYTSAGKFEVGLYNNSPISTASTSLTTPLNNWYYLGLTYDGSTIRGYLNGQQFNTVGMNNWTTSASDFFHIGSSQNGTCFSVTCSNTNAASFLMGEFTVYRSALSAAEVFSNFEATTKRFGPTIGNPSTQSTYVNKSATFSIPSCTATTSGSSTCSYQWQLSTNGGASYSDISSATTFTYTTPALSLSSSGNRYRVITYDPGTGSPTSQRLFSVSTAATLSVSTPLGSDTDTALTLSAGKWAWASDSNEFDVTSAITMQAWVYQTATNAGSWNMVMNKENSYELGTIGSLWYFGLQGSGGWSGVNTGIATRLNEWQHVALTRAAGSSTANFYVNGQLVWTGTADGASTGNLTNSSEPFTIGGRSSDGVIFSSPFVGTIDEVRVFRSARTKAEIAADMHSYGPINTSNLALYYDFNEGSGDTLFNRVSGTSISSDLRVAYTIRKFTRSYLTSSGGWKPPVGVSRVRALVVAGGGGGGNDEGGGGGGGGFIDTASVTVTADTTTAVIVGYGGIGAEGNDVYYATNGQNSTFGTLIAIGGGAGGSSVNVDNASARNGTSGGSGGGGAGEAWAGRAGGSGTSGQGFAGGIGIVSGAGGGGGGAIEVGNTDGNSLGGDGKTSNITGVNVIYGGGGSGGNGNTSSTSFAGSDGGGGRGGSSNVTALNGTAGLGGGGGGGGSLATANSSVAFSGADGGSGVVIIRWITASAPTFTVPVAVDTTTALTRYTFRTSGAASSPLTRNFQWQFSTDTGTSWSTVQASTSDSYTTGLLDLGTSGPRYRYRVIVTDSDTAGLSISDSSTSYLVLNRYPTISPPASNDSGLLVHLDASQSASYPGSGTSWNDVSANARHASLGISSGGPVIAGHASGLTCSAPTFSTANGGAFSFAGDTVSTPRNCAWIPNSRYTDVGETFTVEVWANPATASQTTWTALIATPWYTGNDKVNFAIGFNGSQTTAGVPDIWGGIFDGSNWYQTPITGLPINSWSHVSLTSSNRVLTLYVNGEAKQSVSLAGSNSISGTNKGVLIGRRWDGTQTYNGSIGTVRISNTALSAEQIRQNYYLSSNRFSNTASGVKSSSTTYATTLTETFTATNGTGSKRFTFTPNNRAGIVWDTSTANSAVLRVTSALNVGTYYETMTATDSSTASTSLGLTITVNKARQASLSIGQYNAFPGVSTYPINVYGGSGSGAVVRSLTDSGTASCTLASSMFLSAVRPGTCTVRAVKDGGINYFNETATATIYWIQWSDAYATRAPSTPTEIVLNHSTAITKYNYDTLTVTSYQNSSGVTITSIAASSVIRIIGDGFDPTAAYTEVVFASMDALDLTSGLQVISSGGSNYLQLTVPSGVTTGVITVNSPKGTAVGPTLTITP
jgi:hypothetical protein